MHGQLRTRRFALEDIRGARVAPMRTALPFYRFFPYVALEVDLRGGELLGTPVDHVPGLGHGHSALGSEPAGVVTIPNGGSSRVKLEWPDPLRSVHP